MRFSRIGGCLAAFIILPVVSSIGTAPEVPVASFPLLHTFHFTMGEEKFSLQEVDVGVKYGCLPRTKVGVILKDDKGFTRWSFNVEDTATWLAINGCPPISGTSEATVAGIAIPSQDTAVWVIDEFMCGGSCFGSIVHVFSFHLWWKRFGLNSSKYDRLISEDIRQTLGRGGVKFVFPRLVLYVNNGYKECPSHFTKMTYDWTRIENGEYFILANAVAYTTRQCESNYSHWPPDPGE